MKSYSNKTSHHSKDFQFLLLAYDNFYVFRFKLLSGIRGNKNVFLFIESDQVNERGWNKAHAKQHSAASVFYLFI
jgi:hypothetical protein